MNAEVWIGSEAAVKLVRESRWGRARLNRGKKEKTLFDFLKTPGVMSPDEEVRHQLYYRWCVLALEAFANEYSASVKSDGDNKQYDESALRDWLDSKYDDDVIDEFGAP